MDENRIPYFATPGGKTDVLIRQFIAERERAAAARIAYLESKGADVINIYGNDSAIVGLVVNSEKIPAGWRHDRARGTDGGNIVIVPDARKKQTFAALRDELRSIPSLPDVWELARRFSYGPIVQARRALFVTYEIIGQYVIVIAPRIASESDGSRRVAEFVPEDSKALKLSEYYALKEAQPASP